MFKQIPIYKNYSVSANGQVMSGRNKKIMKPKVSNGYESICIYNDGKKHYHNVHRLVAITWLDLPSNYNDLHVAHNDGDRRNNHYKNLRWTTAKDNTHDKYKHGTMDLVPEGEAHHNKKLSISTVVELRDRVRCGERFMAVISDMGIKKLTGYDAVTGKTWKSVNRISLPVQLKG